MSSLPEGFEIAEGDGFLTSVREILGSAQRWDEIRAAVDWALHLNPTDPSFATRLAANLWVTQIHGPPELGVFYEVNERDRIVTYQFVAMN
jgi:hypothetical protein